MRSSFESLPLETQLAQLEAEVAAGAPTGALLARVEDLRDPAPAAHLASLLASSGRLDRDADRAALAAFIVARRPETVIHRVVEALAAAREPGASRALLDALAAAPVERLPILSLVDRALARCAPALRDGYAGAVLERVEAAIAAGGPSEPALDLLDLDDLAYIRGRQLAGLRALARQHGRLADLDARRAALAEAALEAIAAAPKGVSQANAEALLATRVYTEPGHFLFELLQNAEDAGATSFRVELSPEGVRVRHDGAPFDARDAVGVCSIGQTTKEKSQIGFFGVGFKAVYEITARPRIHSDVYHFEIADVSVPRPLTQRPQLAEGETLIVLPWRPGLGPERSPEALFERFSDLDPCILLTLRHLRHIEATLSLAGQAPRRREIRRESRAEGEATLVVRPAGPQGRIHYRLSAEERRWTGPSRPPGRPESTLLLVGVRVGPYGQAIRLDPASATAWSHLPTSEATGLRFFVQAHFDVPVDRERLDPDSAWNRWLMAAVPARLADLAARLATDAVRARELLKILPLGEELASPLYHLIVEGLPDALAGIPLLPGQDGAAHPADRAVLTTRAIAALLGDSAPGVLCGRQGRLSVVEPGLDARGRRLALGLGAAELDEEALLGALEREGLGELATPDSVRGLVTLPWRAQQIRRLAALRLARESGGRWRRPAELWRASGRLRQSAEGLLPLLDPALDDPALAGVWEALGARELTVQPLVDALLARAEEPAGAPALHGSLAPLAELLTPPVQEALRSAPIWPDRHGRLRPLVGPDAAMVPADPDIVGLLPSLAWLDPALVEAPHLQVVAPDPIDLQRLLDAVARMAGPEGRRIGAAHAERIAAHLAARADDLTTAELRAALRLPIYADTRGRRGPLQGPHAVRAAAPRYAALLDLSGERVMRPETLVELAPLLEAAGVAPAGLPALVARLDALDPVPPGGARAPIQADAHLDALQRCLVEEREALAQTASSARISRLPIWRTRSGAIVGAAAALDPTRLSELLPELRGDGALLGRCLHPEDLVRAKALGPLIALAERPRADATGRLRLEALWVADRATHELVAGLPLQGELLHPDLPPDDAERGRRVPPPRVLEAVSRRALDADRRALFYAWLVDHEGEAFGDPAFRAALAEAELFPTVGGALLSPSRLVLSTDMPAGDPRDLGVDWAPSPEIPAATLALLRRHLGVGQPEPGELVRTHLRPAYEAAVEADEPERAGRLLAWIARTLADAAPSLRGAVTAGAWRLESGAGRWRAADELAVLDADLAPLAQAVFGAEGADWQPHPRLQAEGMVPLLRALGVAEAPPGEALGARLSAVETAAEAVALAQLVGALVRRGELPERLSLSSNRWVPDGGGALRRPGELFAWSAELEALIGNAPALYPDEAWVDALGLRLARRLGLKGPREVRLADVVRHLDLAIAAGRPVAFRVYEWLEEGLEAGLLDPDRVEEALAPRPWVLSDDGEYQPATRVIGQRALRLFGARRAYWERGRERCPRLFALLGIPEAVDPDVVVEFIGEVGREAEADARLLEREPGLERLLLSCYAWLGARAGVEAAVARLRGAASVLAREVGAGLRLVDPADLRLVRSETPTLEAAFATVGTLWVAVPGEGADRRAVERFHALLGLRRLREAYEVRLAPGSGRDLTGRAGPAIARLRELLRALLGVLPRVQLMRRSLDAAGWLYAERLGPLADLGVIAAIDGLAVDYVLEGVGRTPAAVDAVYDPHGQRLLVDIGALERPAQRAPGLAAGLLGCIYEGEGEEQLADILEILLRLQTRPAMDSYLDARHFPRVDAPRSRSWLAERVGAALDYGLLRRLGADLEALRDPAFLATLPERPESSAGLERWARETARALCQRAGVRDGREAAEAKWAELLQAERLDEVQPVGGPTPVIAPAVPVVPPSAPTPEPPPQPEARGLVGWIRRWFGLDDAAAGAATSSRPPWAAVGANSFTPRTHIGPQLGFDAGLVQRLQSQAPPAWLRYTPGDLPLPWRYGIERIGASFDARSQAWSSRGAPLGALRRTWTGQPDGQRVRFEGQLQPGACMLSLPMSARLVGEIQVLEGPRDAVAAPRRRPSGELETVVTADGPVRVAYEVELLTPPSLRDGAVAARALDPALLRPTVPARLLPREARELASRVRRSREPDWQRAREVVAFVVERYRYDRAFSERPAVRALIARKARHPNQHLAILHASAGEGLLGRGMCFELNSMVLELLRHAGIPAVLATGWIYDLGWVAWPDHLFAAAVVRGAEGPTLYALDAAVSEGGQVEHTLLWKPPEPQVAAPGGTELSVRPPRGAPAWGPGGGEVAQGASGLEALLEAERAREEKLRRAAERALAVATRVLGRGAERPGASLPVLKRELGALLGGSRLADALIRAVAGGYEGISARDQLPGEVVDLQRLGLVEIEEVPSWRVRPRG